MARGVKRTDAEFHTYFWSLVEKTDGCWLWKGKTDRHGYGTVSWRGKRWSAHRAAWVLKHGEIDSETHVLHECDTPACVCPKHLFEGDQVSNMKDRDKKGRVAHGEGHYAAKLTEEDVRVIRAARDDLTVSIEELATRYDVSPARISEIAHRKAWRRVA